MNQPSNQPRWTDDEIHNAVIAQFLIMREEPNPDLWAESADADLRDFAAAFLALQGVSRMEESQQHAVRRQFAAAVNLVLGNDGDDDDGEVGCPEDEAWLRRRQLVRPRAQRRPKPARRGASGSVVVDLFRSKDAKPVGDAPKAPTS